MSSGPIEASNIGYSGNNIWTMGPEGEVRKHSIGLDIPYPYFYGKNDVSGENVVVEVERQKIRILEMNSIDEVQMEKISVNHPAAAKQLRGLAGRTAEDDIPYIERRLGADGIVAWVKPRNIAYVDIENDRKTGKISLVGAVPKFWKEVGTYEPFYEEKDFYKWIVGKKIGAVLAWNGSNYDYRFLTNGGEYWDKVYKVDAMELYSRAFHRPNRGLDAIARVEKIGKKLDEAEVGLEAYNKNDCQIMLDIIEKYSLLDVQYSLASLTGVVPSGLKQIAMLENYIMKNREKYQIWLKGQGVIPKRGKYQGALVLGNSAGIHTGIADLDFSGLYPSAMMYENYVGNGEEVWRAIQTVMKDFIALKEWAGKQKKQTGNPMYGLLREAYKVLGNGSYGVLGTPYFRYYEKKMGEFIAATAREKLLAAREIVSELGIPVIYSDTDSAFVKVEEARAGKVLEIINKRLYPYSAKIECYFKKIMFSGTAEKMIKKKYVGETTEGEMIIKGFETIRSDWSPWSREFQARLFGMIIKESENGLEERIAKYVAGEKKRILSGEMDPSLVGVTKSIDVERLENGGYKSKTQACRAYEQMDTHGEGVISFVEFWIGKKGEILTEQTENLKDKIDWKRVWEKQGQSILKRLEGVIKMEKEQKSIVDWVE